MQQQTKPRQLAELHLSSEVYRWSNAVPKATITCGKLHPSPPNSNPSPLEANHSIENSEEPRQPVNVARLEALRKVRPVRLPVSDLSGQMNGT
jgi:hypothetical protein